MYRKRLLENKIAEFIKYFKIVLLTGARQVGKTTLVSQCFSKYKLFTFDPLQDLYGVRKDPDMFLNNFPAPLFLDEVQFVPELLPALKRRVDESTKKGLYVLSGSQNMSVMKGVSESLAGRVGIINLSGMIPYEIENQLPKKSWLEVYFTDPDNLLSYCKGCLLSDHVLFSQIWRGGYPGLLEIPDKMVFSYFSSYVQTYVERDVRLLENIQDLTLFDQFIGLMSALTAQEINYSQIGRDIGINPKTAHKWIELLKYTYQWRELPAYANNVIKRISQKRKGYFRDTGLASYLLRISSYEALARHPLLGALFESFCVNILLAFCECMDMPPQVYHWRAISGAEVDVVFERDGILFPVEIKCKTTLSKNDARGIKAFYDTYTDKKIAPGIILYAGSEAYKITQNIYAIPWNVLID